MDSPERILVIFLSATLLIFLVLGIVVLVKVIQIANQARRIGDKVDHITDKAGTLVDLMGKMAPTVVFSRLFSMFKSRTSRRGRAKKE